MDQNEEEQVTYKEPEPIQDLEDLVSRLYGFIEETHFMFLDEEGDPYKDDPYAKMMVDEAHILMSYIDPKQYSI